MARNYNARNMLGIAAETTHGGIGVYF
jgi:hypothetical protein